MADSRKSYTVTLQGIPHTMLLSQEDAAAYGERAVLAKSETHLKKEAEAEAKEEAAAKAASTPANKARTVENK